MKTLLCILLLTLTAQAQQLTVLTDSKVLRLVDEQGREVGSFTLPTKEPITLTIQRHQSQPVAYSVDRQTAILALNGSCLPPLTRLTGELPKGHVLVIAKDLSRQAVTDALAVALHTHPQHLYHPVGVSLPEGHKHVGHAWDVENRREVLLIVGPTPVIRFCQ